MAERKQPAAGSGLSEELDALRGAMDGSGQQPAWRLAAGLIVLVAVAFAAAAWFGVEQARPEIALIYDRGVAPADPDGGDAWVGAAVSRAIATQLAVSGEARIVNSGADSPFAGMTLPDARIRQVSGAEWSITGDVERLDGDAVVLRLALTDLRSGALLPEAEIYGSVNAVGDLSARAAVELLDRLGRAPPDAETLRRAEAELPAGAIAGRAYTEALEAIARGDGGAALDHLAVLEQVSPDHPLLFSARSQAWALLGYAQRAEEDAARAWSLRTGLSRERELTLEARMLETAGDWAGAVEIWRALRRFYPDEIGYGLRLADAQMRADAFDDGLATLADLRALPDPAGADPRIDLQESRIHNRAGRYAQGLEAAGRAIARAREIGALALVAEGQMAAVASDPPDKRARLQEARDIYAERGNPRGESTILKELADLEITAGNLAGGVELYRASIDVAGQAGNPTQQAATQNALGIAYDLQGRLLEGYEAKQQVTEYYRQRGVQSRYSIMLENLGISLFKLGRYDEALQSFDAALEIFEEIGDEIGIAWGPYHRGRIAIRRGELEAGRALMETAVANAVDRPEGGLDVNARFELMIADWFAGRLEPALEQAERLSAEYADLDQPLDKAETDIYAGEILLALGEPERAAAAIAAAQQPLDQAGAGYYAAAARLAAVDLGFAQSEEAARAACGLLPAATEQEHLLVRLRAEVRLVACEAWAGPGASPALADRLSTIAAEADSAGLFEPGFDARRTRAHVLALLGRDEEARAGIAALNARAAEAGWRTVETRCLTGPPSRACTVTASAAP